MDTSNKLVEAFLTSERAAGAPATTLRARRQHLLNLARTCGVNLAVISDDELVVWFGAREWAPETRRSRRTTFRAFFGWLEATGRREGNPALALRRVRAAVPLARPAPERVYRKALLKARPRERLWLRLAAEAGLRRGEIAVIHSDDVIEDMVGVSLLVHGKGRRERVVPLSEGVAFELLRWFDAHGEGFAFPGERDGHLSPEYVGKRMAKLLDGHWTAHTLRHRFASQTFLVDRDVFAVQELLGHASPTTTRRYVPRANDEHLRRTVNRAAA